MVWHYDSSQGLLRTAFTVSQSVVPIVVCRSEFWGFFAFHLLVNCAYRAGILGNAESEHSFFFLHKEEMKVVAAVTTFFEVFYTNHCFHRYLHLHGATREMLGYLYQFSYEVRVHLAKASIAHVRLATRWFMSSVVLFLHMGPDRRVPEATWRMLLRQSLLRPEEQQRLLHLPRQQAALILLSWTAEACVDGWKKAKAPATCLKSAVDKLMATRRVQQEVADTLALPMPYQYFHLLKLMVVVNLVVWAYFFAVTKSIFAPVIFFFCALFFMGMVELAAAMSDPFGDDEVDFPIAEWLNDFLEGTSVLVNTDHPQWLGTMDVVVQAETPFKPLTKRMMLILEDEPRARTLSCGSGAESSESSEEESFTDADRIALLDKL